MCTTLLLVNTITSPHLIRMPPKTPSRLLHPPAPTTHRLYSSQFAHIRTHTPHHARGLSPVWVRRCTSRLLESENFLSHVRQTCGSSSLSHVSHTHGFSPVWVSMWRSESNFSLLTKAKYFPHSSQPCFFSISWPSSSFLFPVPDIHSCGLMFDYKRSQS